MFRKKLKDYFSCHMHTISVAFERTNDKISKRMKIIWTILLCLLLIGLLLFSPEVTHEGADIGVTLFMEALFPYLLPYLVLTNWLLKLTHSYNRASFLVFLQTYGISAKEKSFCVWLDYTKAFVIII